MAFLCKIIDLLEIGGKACIVIPDGILESPTLSNLRKDFLENWLLMALINSACVLTALMYEGCVENH